ncbi:MAG TPA: hypothetical protein VN861_14625 [Candidatus Acidoferrales bacterium]|jgi:hypothetical protein|nr:hypothetical protein [Candidatus Acidoferrales bacterium]
MAGTAVATRPKARPARPARAPAAQPREVTITRIYPPGARPGGGGAGGTAGGGRATGRQAGGRQGGAPQRPGGAPRKSAPSIPRPASRNYGGDITANVSPAIGAEYVICLVIIVLQQMTSPGDYATRMGSMLWRITSLTAVFFILALTSTYDKAAKVTVAFGALIVGGVLYHAGNNMASTLAQVSGQGRVDSGTGVTVTSDVVSQELSTPAPPHNIAT